MGLIKLFDFVDTNLNPVLHIEGLKNFYEELENPIVEYYTFNSIRFRLSEDVLKYFLVGDFHESGELEDEALFSKEHFSSLEKAVFENLNKKFDLNVKYYNDLIYLKKSSGYDERYVIFEEHLDRFQENIFESEIIPFYSLESANFIKGLKG
jgi:hypothetical protein